MQRILAYLLLAIAALPAAAVQRHPTGVNVNTQGPTTVFITYGGLRDQAPAEAFWCGELMPAAPAVGFMCKPDTIFGRLPLRYVVGSMSSPLPPLPAGVLAPLLPNPGAIVAASQPAVLSWIPARGAAFYRAEVLDSAGKVVASALLPAHLGTYALPPWVREQAAPGELRWRVEALDPDGAQVAATEWRSFTFAPAPR